MKNIIYLFITFSFLLSSFNSYSQDINKKDSKGRKQGVWIKAYKGKKAILYKGKFKDGLPVGEFIFFYESGSVKARNRYVNKGKDSYVSTYYENGKLMSMGKYVNQKKDSVWVYLDQWGNYSSRDTYKKGEKHGKCIIFYPFNPRIDNGSPQVLEIAFYEEGEKHGEYQKFYKNGKVLTQGNYEFGVYEGLVTFFYPTGVKRTTINYKHGFKHGFAKNYDGNGKLVSKQYYRKGYLLEGKALKDYLDLKRKLKAKKQKK